MSFPKAGRETLEPYEADMAMLEHDTWVMVGDGEKALFLRNEGDKEYPNLEVVRLLEHENPPTREQGADRPGRFPDGTGPQRSAVDNTDWHEIEKARFARTIAERLYEAAHRGRFKRLIIVAPPRVLGELRHELHKEVTDRVVAEIDKELTKHPIEEIERILKSAVK
jgi:protein required for attachment to host cells